MFDYSMFEKQLRDKIGDKRLDHSKRVYQTALNLNNKIPKEKIFKAALFHDCAKYNEVYYLKKYKNLIDFEDEILENKLVLHAFLGSIVAKVEYNINDREILDAIKFHTTGRANMSDLEKIIFLADAIEPKRSYEGVEEIRKISKIDIDKAILYCLDGTIKSLLERKVEICTLTIESRNYLIKEKND